MGICWDYEGLMWRLTVLVMGIMTLVVSGCLSKGFVHDDSEVAFDYPRHFEEEVLAEDVSVFSAESCSFYVQIEVDVDETESLEDIWHSNTLIPEAPEDDTTYSILEEPAIVEQNNWQRIQGEYMLQHEIRASASSVGNIFELTGWNPKINDKFGLIVMRSADIQVTIGSVVSFASERNLSAEASCLGTINRVADTIQLNS